MTDEIRCPYCQTAPPAYSGAVLGKEWTCTVCERVFIVGASPEDFEELELDDEVEQEEPAPMEDLFGDFNPEASTDDLFAEAPEVVEKTPANLADQWVRPVEEQQQQQEQQPQEPQVIYGEDGLTDSQRLYDRIVRVAGYVTIGVSVLLCVLFGLLSYPEDAWPPIVFALPALSPLIWVGYLMGVHGAVFGEDAASCRQEAPTILLLSAVIGAGAGGLVLILAPLASSDISGVFAAFCGLGAIAAVGANAAFWLSIAGLLTGQAFWKIIWDRG